MSEITPRKLFDDVMVLIDDVEELLKVTADETGERARDLRHRLEQTIAECKRALAADDRLWLQKADHLKTAAESYFRENPWSKVALAAGIGLIFGLLLRRDGR